MVIGYMESVNFLKLSYNYSFLFFNKMKIVSNELQIRIKNIVQRFFFPVILPTVSSLSTETPRTRSHTAKNPREARQWLKQHRTEIGGDLTILMQHITRRRGLSHINDSMLTCTSPLTRLYHTLTEKMLCEKRLQACLPDMKAKARELIEETVSKSPLRTRAEWNNLVKTYCFQVFMKDVIGYVGSFKDLRENPNFCSSKEWWIQLFTHCRYEEKSSTVGYLRAQGLGVMQIKGVISDLLEALMFNVPPASLSTIERYARDGELQENLFKVLREKEQQKLTPEVMAVLVENLRLNPTVSTISRLSSTDIYEVDIAGFARQEEIVGPNPRVFNPTRFTKVKTAWPLLPWFPFGRGPHMCPGWRLFKYLAAQFIEVLVHDYQISEVRHRRWCKSNVVYIKLEKRKPPLDPSSRVYLKKP